MNEDEFQYSADCMHSSLLPFVGGGGASRGRIRPDVQMTARTRWRPAGKWSEDVNIISSVQTSRDFHHLSPWSVSDIVHVPCIWFRSRNRGIFTETRAWFCAMFWKSVCAKRTINSWRAFWPAWTSKTHSRRHQKNVSTSHRTPHRLKVLDQSDQRWFVWCLRWFPRWRAAVLIKAAEVEERFSRQSSFKCTFCPPVDALYSITQLLNI